MRSDLQEGLALGIVGLVVGYGVYKAFIRHGAAPLSVWLLQHGRVKWAMWLRRKAR